MLRKYRRGKRGEGGLPLRKERDRISPSAGWRRWGRGVSDNFSQVAPRVHSSRVGRHPQRCVTLASVKASFVARNNDRQVAPSPITYLYRRLFFFANTMSRRTPKSAILHPCSCQGHQGLPPSQIFITRLPLRASPTHCTSEDMYTTDPGGAPCEPSTKARGGRSTSLGLFAMPVEFPVISPARGGLREAPLTFPACQYVGGKVKVPECCY